MLVWGHFVLGLHYWLRLHTWYRRAFRWLPVAYVVLPMAALLGFAEAGMGLSTLAEAHPEWWQKIRHMGMPADPHAAHLRAFLKGMARAGVAGAGGARFCRRLDPQ